MRENELRELLAETHIPYNSGFRGLEFQVVSIPEWDFVIKVPVPDPIKDLKYSLRGYKHALRHLKDCIPKTSVIENLDMLIQGPQNLQSVCVPVAIVQEKKLLLTDYLDNIQDHPDSDPVEIGKAIARVDFTMQQRGCFKMEAEVNDYGIDGNSVLHLDLGTVIRGDSNAILHKFDPQVRGYQLYNRYWYLQEHAPASLVDAYKKESKLGFKDLNTTISPQDLHAVEMQLLQNARQSTGPLAGFVGNTMQDPERRRRFARTTILKARYGKEFTGIGLEERNKYYKRGGVGERAEPFISS